MTLERGQKRVHAFADKDGFDRVARSARYVERLMKGVTEPTPYQYAAQSDGTVRVQTINPNPSGGSTPPFPIPSGDGLYPGRFVYYDVELQDYRPLGEVKEETHLCLMFGMNQEDLEFPSDADDFDGKYYRGRVVGYYIDVAEGELQTDVAYEQWKGVPVVEVTVGGGGSVSDWRPGYVVSRSAGPPVSYTVQPLKLNGAGSYVIDGDEKEPCYRMPSAKWDEPVLIEIPDPNGADEQGVMWRPDPDEPDKYQMSPWGGLWKVVIKQYVFSCPVCQEVSPGVFEFIHTNVYRKLAIFSRDLRFTWKPPETAEGPIEGDLEETP